MRGAWLLVLPLLTAGCFQALLRESPSSTLGFTCAAMDPVQADTLVIQSWTGPALSFNATPAVMRLASLLVGITGRPPSQILVDGQIGPVPPPGGWNRTLLAGQAQSFLRQRIVTLRILWVDSMAETATGFVAGPGTVVVAFDSVAAAAQRIGRPVDAVALGVLLHQVGHGLGETNLGVPVQDPAIGQREGPPGHDRDPASVLNLGWDDARTVVWSGNATYDGYLPGDMADWAAARQPGGVCA